MVCYIRKYVIILGDIPVDVPPNQNIGGDVSPASPAALTPVHRPGTSIVCMQYMPHGQPCTTPSAFDGQFR